MNMKVFYLDTSVINQLYDDSKSDILINRLKDIATVVISIFNVVELASTNDKNRRIGLINAAKKLSNNYRPLAMPGDILKRSLVAICNNHYKMDNSIGSEWDNIWIAQNDPELIDNDFYVEICEWKNYQEEWYQKMHEHGRPNLQKVLLELPKSKRNDIVQNFSKILKYYSQQDELIANFIEKVNVKNNLKLSNENIRKKILNHSEHWRFFLAAMVYGLYVRSCRESNYSKKKNPGSIDTQQSVYLATCDIIVSADIKQYNMMRLLVPLGHKNRFAWKYKKLREWILNNI